MATTKELAKLFRALAGEDISSARAIATQICKREENKRHRSAARVLRSALNLNGGLSLAAGSSHASEGRNGSGVLSTAIAQLATDVRLKDVVLVPSAQRELQAIILEWKHRERLRKRGILPRARLLFHGPPGCGKSLTGRALGCELGIPTYVVRFEAVIGAYLGQTAIHLRQLFHFAETTPCVLLLDEMDALGKQRGSPLDVGELDRIVIALMQELEHSDPMGLIIGTSNLAKHLDKALWRRFDLALRFGKPRPKTLAAFATRVATANGCRLSAAVTARASKADSFAQTEQIVIAEVRRQALRDV